MRKKIKKWGDSLVIVFNKDDVSLYGLKEGDVIELDEGVLETRRNVQGIVNAVEKKVNENEEENSME